jgi:hypothetical protein
VKEKKRDHKITNRQSLIKKGLSPDLARTIWMPLAIHQSSSHLYAVYIDCAAAHQRQRKVVA